MGARVRARHRGPGRNCNNSGGSTIAPVHPAVVGLYACDLGACMFVPNGVLYRCPLLPADVLHRCSLSPLPRTVLTPLFFPKDLEPLAAVFQARLPAAECRPVCYLLAPFKVVGCPLRPLQSNGRVRKASLVFRAADEFRDHME